MSVTVKEFSEALSEAIGYIEPYVNSSVAVLYFLETKRTFVNSEGIRSMNLMQWLAYSGKKGLEEVRGNIPFWIEDTKRYEREIKHRP